MSTLAGRFLFSSSLFLQLVASMPSHFGESCSTCACFVEYTDRDVALPSAPYASAANGYDSSEERCLAACLRDKKCKAVVYGLVGGRAVFTCEFYELAGVAEEPLYVPYTNIYVRRAGCSMPLEAYEEVEMAEAGDASVKRRVKLALPKRNPFFG